MKVCPVILQVWIERKISRTPVISSSTRKAEAPRLCRTANGSISTYRLEVQPHGAAAAARKLANLAFMGNLPDALHRVDQTVGAPELQ